VVCQFDLNDLPTKMNLPHFKRQLQALMRLNGLKLCAKKWSLWLRTRLGSSLNVRRDVR